ncbi:MAG: hypothetical protein CTY16_15945 [Methylobacter sp.]|uniref:bacteriohemerythrin n=1 Tax=Methylovulum miyakonense TaxID=645578 RepID=UPI000367B404|nr:bacteriohemerythrin [Methylovulum miyakonense]PPD41486.1 MAG: hypothetical protein CTY16_15945 [Methylobacter sp.]
MLVWSDSFATKIEIVDTQHKKLFELLNRLPECVASGRPDPEMIDSILKELMAYADKHFVDEELLMAHHHLDPRHINVHRMEHKSFMYDVQNMWEHLSLEEDLTEVSEKLVRFVTSWLTYHILGIDQVMALQIFAIHHGETPEQAYELRHTIKYDSATTHLMLDSVLDLWHMSMDRCHRLETKLAALENP